jgi:uncharacterized protein YacL (UPF0231 family)
MPNFDTNFNKQELLEKFSKVLDRAEEIAQNEDFIKYKNKYIEYINSEKTEIDINQLALESKEIYSKLSDSIQFDDRLDSAAFMIAIAGNNCMF